MKNSSASIFLKHVISVLRSFAKAKSMAIKSKTDDVRVRFLVFSFLKDKKLSLDTISHKIHDILGLGQHGKRFHDDNVNEIFEESSKAIVLYNESHSSHQHTPRLVDQRMEEDSYIYDDGGDDDDKYPDLRHSLFDDEEDEMDLGDPNSSVIDLVRSAKEEGEEFSLENEIDHVADLFIMKFHKRMRMQKLASFKRYQEMLERSA